ncbi:hypothetical protein T484DRAFT_1814200 [Baffinella frigidus]|nr:hypothetical protein T484DRAFT_1814200 [Cryptophyta sp. CCMP2293]
MKEKQEVWAALQSAGVLSLMQSLSGIVGLEHDPHLHGAGLHYHPVRLSTPSI